MTEPQMHHHRACPVVGCDYKPDTWNDRAVVLQTGAGKHLLMTHEVAADYCGIGTDILQQCITSIEAESRNATLTEVMRAVEGLPYSTYREIVIDAVKALLEDGDTERGWDNPAPGTRHWRLVNHPETLTLGDAVRAAQDLQAEVSRLREVERNRV